MLKQINPDAVVVYGDGNKEHYPWIPQSLEVEFVMSNRIKRLRANG